MIPVILFAVLTMWNEIQFLRSVYKIEALVNGGIASLIRHHACGTDNNENGDGRLHHTRINSVCGTPRKIVPVSVTSTSSSSPM